MAWYTVTHSCEHEQRHQLYGKTRERESKLNWLAGTLCTECYRAAQQTKREQEAKAAAAKNAERGLPPLTGTEGQIAWAERVRGERSRDFLRCLTQLAAACRGCTDETLAHVTTEADQQNNPVAPVVFAMCDRLEESTCESPAPGDRSAWGAEIRTHLEIFTGRTSASWWIDNRDVPLTQWDELLKKEKAAAVQAEAARLAKEAAWAEKDAAAETLRGFFPDADLPFTCEVWNKSDKRVYIGHGFNKNFVTYYHDGKGSRVRPGTLELRDGGYTDEDKENLKEFLASLCKEWNTVKIVVAAKKEVSA